VNGPIKVRIRDRVAQRLVSHNAMSPASAVAFQSRNAFERWLLARLLKRGAVLEVAPGRYYLDAARYTVQNAAWERRATPISFSVAIGLAILAVLFYRGGG
jgi:hypothetical protein